MILKPFTIAELSQSLASAHAQGTKIEGVDLSALRRVLEHKSEDMTATVEAGITLTDLQSELAQRGQWLPLDPPHPDKITVGDLLARNPSGPRRFGYGIVGDYLIGLKAVLPDGRIISPGGKVVKNVAGYDLAKLFIGGHGTLGIVVEATFKLRPLPEMETFVTKTCADFDEVETLISAVLKSEITPHVLDLYRLTASGASTFVLGFAGTQEEVAWQVNLAQGLTFQPTGSLAYENAFWTMKDQPKKTSVLPSKLVAAVRDLAGPFVARAGNGVVFHHGPMAASAAVLPRQLMRRLKDEFDPKHILPELTLP